MVQGFRFGVTIDGDALSRDAGEAVGRGRVSLLPCTICEGFLLIGVWYSMLISLRVKILGIVSIIAFVEGRK